EALRILRTPRMAKVAEDHPGGGGEPDDPLARSETIQAVRDAIDQLPEHFRAALVLCEYEQMSYNQIAEVLGCSVPQVKTWLFRGRTKLAEMLKEHVDGKRKRKD